MQRVRKEEQEGADIKHRAHVGVKQSFVFIPHPAELISILPFLLRVSTRQPLKQARSGLKLHKSPRWAAPTPSCGPHPHPPTHTHALYLVPALLTQRLRRLSGKRS